jgi:two-component system chemotaxis response regulator CheY
MTAANALSVLLVDDHKPSRILVRETLRALGVKEIGEADSGQAALVYMKHETPDLVISDFHMPEMDGLELLRKVRDDARLKKTAFIMLSARGEAAVVQQAIALGVNNYIVKPFTAATLLKKIEAVVGKIE